MKLPQLYRPIIVVVFFLQLSTVDAQLVNNKFFSFGSYGRIGVAYSPALTGSTSRGLNLNGMGSIGGRLEETGYVELISALHFTPKTTSNDSTQINVQARIAMFTAGAQYMGNINTQTINGLTIALPELYAEANHINGTKWSAWVGAKYFRDNDVHIADHFYFDDHSSQGFGVKHHRTQFSVMFPAVVDTNSSVPPYFYNNVVNGTASLSLRQRTVFILEHSIPIGSNNSTLKLLGEWHKLADANAEESVQAGYNYPSDIGFVIGAKHTIDLPTKIKGSFQQFAIRYGTGIANGGDGGASKTWLTYGAPNLKTNQFSSAYSFSLVEHFLTNVNKHLSLNGYLIYTKSKGASDSANKAPDYFGKSVFNNKTDFSWGIRSTYYMNNWFHLIGELDYANRKDGNQAAAAMMKFTIMPTLVPSGKRDVWARPQFRLVLSAAHYNSFAQNNLYSSFLQHAGKKEWGTYIGIKTEWWLY